MPLHASGTLASLGAEIPVIAAPMAGGPSTPALVVAAAGAGGLGFLAGGYQTAASLGGQIDRVRAATGLFGVNLFVPNPTPVEPDAYAAYAEALAGVAEAYGLDIGSVPIREDDDDWPAKVEMLVDDPVPVVSFTFAVPPPEVVARLRSAGSVTVQSVTTLAEAQTAAAAGVDALVVQCHLAGAHSATTTPGVWPEEVPLATLVSRVRAAVPLPVWATGGVATHDQVCEALAAGAEAVAVGTALLRSPESGASAPYKAALADPARTRTLLTRAFSGRPARALHNGFVDRFHDVAPTGYPAVHHLTSPLRRAAAAAGDPEAISLWAGAGVRFTTDERTAVVLRRLAGRT